MSKLFSRSMAAAVFAVALAGSASVHASSYTISGKVTTPDGAGLAGVTLSAMLGAEGGGQATTAADGTYTIQNLTLQGTYTVTPSKAGYTFSPTSRTVTIAPSATGVNFVATLNSSTFTISGTVTNSAGQGVGGVKITATATGLPGGSATTANDGTYTISNLAAATYTVTPSLNGTTFSPASRTVTVGPNATNVNFVAVSGYTISGKVVTASGQALAGVQINVYNASGPGAQVNTKNDGTYITPPLPAGNYSVVPFIGGYTFSPPNRAVTLGPSATGVDFTAIPQGFTISGKVTTSSGAPLPGTLVSAYCAALDVGASATTGADGTYQIAGLAALTYQVTASFGPNPGAYTFSPTYHTVTLGPNATGVDFVGTPVSSGFTISGKVTTAGGQGIKNVLVTAINAIDTGGTALTAADGTYTITGLAAMTYNVFPQLAGWTFTPPTRSVTVGPNATGVDFIGTPVGSSFSISGKVTTPSGQGIPGVVVSAVNTGIDAGGAAVTGNDGAYTISGLAPMTYQVTPTLGGYIFSPPSRSVTVGPNATGVNFIGTTVSNTFSISGKVTSPSGQGIPSVIVTAVNTIGAGGSAVTANDGTYTISGLPAMSYQVTPAKANYTFTPQSRSVSVGPNATGVDFVGTTKYSISGRVTLNGAGLSGIVIGAAKTDGSANGTAVTDGNGNYTISSLSDGTYNVTPQTPGYNFTPGLRQVAVGPNATGIDFAATQQGRYSISGKVTTPDGKALSNVQIVVAGTPTGGNPGNGGVTYTAADGTYSVGNLIPAAYYVTPTLNGYTFNPTSSTVLVGPNATNVNFVGTPIPPPGFTISGKVTLPSGQGIPNVLVSAVNETSLIIGLPAGGGSATTAADGSYTIYGLAAAQYLVTPSYPGYTFTPLDRFVTVGPNATGVNFVGTPAQNLFSISGTVTVNGQGYGGVLILAVNNVDNTGGTAVTAANGTYTISGLKAASYTVYPLQGTYTFSPPQRQVSVGPNATGVDFAGKIGFTISGKVKNAAGQGVGGILVIAMNLFYSSGGTGGSAVTAADGTYAITKLNGGSYIVYASQDGVTFTPGQYQIALPPDASNIDFTITPTYTISGAVTLADGTPVSSVLITAGGYAASTGADGKYTINNVMAGTYTVSASRQGYTFTPPSRSVTVGPSAAGVNFTAGLYSISGTIRYRDYGMSAYQPMPNVLVTVTKGGQTVGQAHTAQDGTYTVAQLGPGNYTVTPAISEYTFNPPSQNVTLGPNATGVDFYATPIYYTINGTVTLNGAGLQGVSVSTNPAALSATTDATGHYSITNAKAGTYTVTPSSYVFPGPQRYLFTPPNRTVTVGPSQYCVDFAASQLAITGRLYDPTLPAGQQGLSGYTITAYSGTIMEYATTGADGSYRIAPLNPGDYLVTAQVNSPHYSVTPPNANVHVGPNDAKQDFQASWTGNIFVTVFNSDPNPVTFTINLYKDGKLVTSQDVRSWSSNTGSTTFKNLPRGTYLVSPQPTSGYTFDPQSVTVTLQDIDGSAIFSAKYAPLLIDHVDFIDANNTTRRGSVGHFGGTTLQMVAPPPGTPTTSRSAIGKCIFVNNGANARPSDPTWVTATETVTGNAQTFTFNAPENGVTAKTAWDSVSGNVELVPENRWQAKVDAGAKACRGFFDTITTFAKNFGLDGKIELYGEVSLTRYNVDKDQSPSIDYTTQNKIGINGKLKVKEFPTPFSKSLFNDKLKVGVFIDTDLFLQIFGTYTRDGSVAGPITPTGSGEGNLQGTAAVSLQFKVDLPLKLFSFEVSGKIATTATGTLRVVQFPFLEGVLNIGQLDIRGDLKVTFGGRIYRLQAKFNLFDGVERQLKIDLSNPLGQ